MTGASALNAAMQTFRSSDQSLVLQCPRCKTVMGNVARRGSDSHHRLVCNACLLQIAKDSEIWSAMVPERERFFSRFIADYETVRAAEGRGSRNPEYYLALPERDLSGRNQEQWNIRRRTFHCLQRKILSELQKKQHLGLDVLDLGAGNGWMSYRLALNHMRPVAVDLLTNSTDGLGAAEHFRSRLPQLFPRFKAEVDRLPFAAAQFDVAIFNASFHYSVNYDRTMREAMRCLRSPGYVVIADTAWYSSEASGEAMLGERRSFFRKKFGFPSDSLPSLEFLTDERLRDMELILGIEWKVFHPNYGAAWKLRPVMARFRGRREPSTFRIYMAEVNR